MLSPDHPVDRLARYPIAGDLALLTLDPTRGRFTIGRQEARMAIAGAVLAELVMLGRVRLEPGAFLKAARVVPESPESSESPQRTGIPELDDALVGVIRGGGHPQRIVDRLERRSAGRVLDGLVERGALDRVDRLLLSSRWPVRDAGRRQQVRGDAHAMLVDGQQVGGAETERTQVIVAMLGTVGKAQVLFQDPVVRPRVLKHRATEIAGNEPVATWVRRALRARRSSGEGGGDGGGGGDSGGA